VIGYVFQAVALFLAPFMLVQPLIVTELLLALPLVARLVGGSEVRTAASAPRGGLASHAATGVDIFAAPFSN